MTKSGRYGYTVITSGVLLILLSTKAEAAQQPVIVDADWRSDYDRAGAWLHTGVISAANRHAKSQATVQEPQIWFGYVVGRDRRIYMVNLATGELEWVSRVLREVGYTDKVDITDIEINPQESILYITSEDYVGRTDYVPLIAVRLNEEADVVFKTPFGHESGSVSGAHSVVLNPALNELYVWYLGGEDRQTVLDPITGQFIGGRDIIIREQSYFSPDGNEVAGFYDRWSRETESGSVGNPALVIVRDIETGESTARINLELNPESVPSWAAFGDYLLYVHHDISWYFSIEIYDRSGGGLLNAYDINQTFGAPSNQFYATRLPGTGNVAMSIGSEVVVFDPLTAEVKSRTYVGDTFLSEVVVSDRPVIPADR